MPQPCEPFLSSCFPAQCWRALAASSPQIPWSLGACMQESLFRQARPPAAGASHAGPRAQSPLPSPRADASSAAPLSPNPNMGLSDVLMLASLGVSGSASPVPGRTGPRGEPPGGFGAATGPGGFLGARLGALGSKRGANARSILSCPCCQVSVQNRGQCFGAVASDSSSSYAHRALQRCSPGPHEHARAAPRKFISCPTLLAGEGEPGSYAAMLGGGSMGSLRSLPALTSSEPSLTFDDVQARAARALPLYCICRSVSSTRRTLKARAWAAYAHAQELPPGDLEIAVVVLHHHLAFLLSSLMHSQRWPGARADALNAAALCGCRWRTSTCCRACSAASATWGPRPARAMPPRTASGARPGTTLAAAATRGLRRAPARSAAPTPSLSSARFSARAATWGRRRAGTLPEGWAHASPEGCGGL